jgi:anti-sigma regulatory factor (Ser/Thr protein kinase)
MSYQRLFVVDSSHTAEARRRSRALAVENGFDETAAEKVAIVTTEAATNLLKHGDGGEILLGASCELGSCFINVLALDRGPGMSDVACRVDGFSTSGTPGTGLGAMSRLSAFFDCYSRPGSGTAILAQVSNNGTAPSHRIPVYGIQLSKPGEEVCGDDFGVQERRGSETVVVADGLGHGTDARIAARAAVDAVRKYANLSPKELIIRMHESMRHTRGAAVGVVELNRERRTAIFSGVGNISARIFEDAGPSRQMVSTNGTAGAEIRTVREFTYPWPIGAAVVLHSDGLSARWDLSDYPGLLTRDPGVIAGVLMRDHCRHTDDATVVVVK